MRYDIKDLDESLIEPSARDEGQNQEVSYVAARMAYSSAVSLKRIADVLTGEGIAELLRTPVNNYGESFTDAIQMSMVRGQRGIDVT